MSESSRLAHVQPFSPELSMADGMRLLAAAASQVSPLLADLTHRMADDEEMLALLTSLMSGQLPMQIHPVVSYLLSGSPDEPLRDYFACYAQNPLPAAGAYPDFREFCLRRQDEIRHMLATRTMQLTFPERAAPVLVALDKVAQAAGGKPLALIEVGCSAGLLLHFDDYRYDFGRHGTLGTGPITIAMELTGPGAKAPARMPAISARVGIELNPVDLHNPDEVAWILASLPPDSIERYQSTAAALAFARDHPTRIVEGDAVALLPDVSATMDGVLCVLNSHCMYQWPVPVREAFEAKLRALSHVRDVHHISIEIGDGAPAELIHRGFSGGEEVIAKSHGRAHNFGDWIELD